MQNKYHITPQLTGPHGTNMVVSMIIPERPGVFVLSKNGRAAHFVGRSDFDIKEGIQSPLTTEPGGTPPYSHAWFQYTDSAADAYSLECTLYHMYSPVDNKLHPVSPESGSMICHICGK